jgi:hypothetical protein
VVLPVVFDLCTGTCVHLPDIVSAGGGCDCTGVCRCAQPAQGIEEPAVVSDVDDGVEDDFEAALGVLEDVLGPVRMTQGDRS